MKELTFESHLLQLRGFFIYVFVSACQNVGTQFLRLVEFPFSILCGSFFDDFVKMGTEFGFRDLPTFMYWLETYLLDDLVQKLRMGSMHSGQDCKK